MRPEDDPEQRIRELERSLSDIARTSELGTAERASAYPPAWPPNTGQNTYGANPFPAYESPSTEHSYAGQPNYSGTIGYPGQTTTHAPSAGLRLGWIVFALLVVGLAVGGVFIGINNTSSPTRPAGPNMNGGGGPLTSGTVRAEPPMTIEVPTPMAPDSSAAPPQTGASISVAGIGSARTVICDNSTVSVSGVDNMVTITGHCARVDVSGVENVVTVESTDSINASGMNNRVRYLSGDPNIEQSGFDNTVERG